MIEAPPDGPLAESVVQSSNGMRGFVVSNDFSGATTAPQIDVKSAVAQDQSVGAIGQGIQNVGGALAHIFEIRNHALDQKAVLQAEAVRGDVGSQVGQALAQPGLDPSDYESTAQKIIDDNQDKLRPNSGTSPNAQDTIGGQTDVWQSQLMGAVRLHSARAAVGQAVDLATTKINGQVANGKYDDARATAGDLNARGFSSAAGHQATLQNIDTAQRTTQFKTGVTNLNTAMANGSIFDVVDAATVIKANTPGDEKTKQAAFDQAMAAGIKGVQNTLETEQHKTDSNVMANVALARINGKPFTPEFIQGMMDSGHVSKPAGVAMLAAAHQEYGATDDQLGPVFTQALTYNHNNDQYDNGAWKAQLDGAFYRLKPSKAQIDQYNAVVANADARNSNPGGPAASALIATGHGLIDQIVTPAQTTNDRTRQFGEFLTDPEKLRQFGFSDEQIRPLAGRTSYNEKAGPALTGPESMNAFIAAFDNRGKTVDGVQRPAIDAAEYNKLSDYTKQLAQDARDGRLVQTNLATPQAVISAGFSKAHMKAVLDARFWPLVQAGKMPLAADVESWVNDLAGKSQDAGFLQNKMPVVSAPGGDSAGQSPSNTAAQPVSAGPVQASPSAPNLDPVAGLGLPTPQGTQQQPATDIPASTSPNDPSATPPSRSPTANDQSSSSDAASSPTENGKRNTENDPPSPSDLQQRAQAAGVQLTPQIEAGLRNGHPKVIAAVEHLTSAQEDLARTPLGTASDSVGTAGAPQDNTQHVTGGISATASEGNPSASHSPSPKNPPPILTPDGLAHFVASEQFKNWPADQRAAFVNQALAASHDILSQQREWTPESQKAWGIFAKQMQKDSASSTLESIGGAVKAVPGVLGGFAKDLGVMGLALADRLTGGGDDNEVADDRRAKGDTQPRTLATAFGQAEAGNATKWDDYFSGGQAADEEDARRSAALDAFQKSAEEGRVPVGDLEKLKAWLNDHAEGLPGLKDPANLPALTHYLKTFSPAAWDQLSNKLLLSPMAQTGNKMVEYAVNSPGGQELPESMRGNLASASDPAGQLMLVAPFLRGAKAVEATSLAAKAAQLGMSAAQQAAYGTLLYMRDHPNGTASGTLSAAAQAALTAVLLSSAHAAVGEGVKGIAKASEPGASPGGTVTPEAVPTEIQAAPGTQAETAADGKNGGPTTNLPTAGKNSTELEPAASGDQSKPLISGGKWDQWADRTLADSRKRLYTGVDPTVLAAYAIKGAALIENGVRKFPEWSECMVKEYGEPIRQHLDDLWKQANDHLKNGLPDQRVGLIEPGNPGKRPGAADIQGVPGEQAQAAADGQTGGATTDQPTTEIPANTSANRIPAAEAAAEVVSSSTENGKPNTANNPSAAPQSNGTPANAVGGPPPEAAAGVLKNRPHSEMAPAVQSHENAAHSPATPLQDVHAEHQEAATSHKTVIIDPNKYPEAAQHLEDAGAMGVPLTVDRAGAAARRKIALKGIKTQPGMDRDEAPPAVFREGSRSVRSIISEDNRGAGGSLGHQIKGVKDGETIIIHGTDNR